MQAKIVNSKILSITTACFVVFFEVTRWWAGLPKDKGKNKRYEV